MEKITSSITELEHAGMKFYATRMGTKDVVSIEGSVLGGWNMLPRDKSEVPELVAELLDAGTAEKSKEKIRESLGARGASISFSAGGDRTYFSASCLPEDVSFVLQVIVECLSGATFPAKELANAKARALGDLIEEKSNTRGLAGAALSRLIYDPKNVNYAETLAERKKSIESSTRNDLIKFRKILGQGGLVLSIAGDISPQSVLEPAKRIFSRLPKGTTTIPEKHANAKIPVAKTELIPVADKANIDVYLGASMPFTYESKHYLPFTVLSEMLGGRGFTSHLMKTIRERDGLTYGVYTMPNGFADNAEGAFRVWATFSPQKYDESIRALKKELTVFFKNELTEKNLLARQVEILGGYALGLSTSRGLAGMLHRVGIEGKGLSYVDEYPELIRTITLKDIQAVAALIPLEKLSLAAAGTFEKSSPKK